VTIDAFIKLHDATVNCALDTHKCTLTMSFADKVPYEELEIVPAVGNASNVAVGIARLGLRSASFCSIGDDQFGKDVLDVYDKEGVGTEFVKINTGMQTNYHFVLGFQAERTILVKHHPYKYHSPELVDDVNWLYFSSIGENTEELHQKIADHLEAHPNVKMGFNPGTFQMKLGLEKIGRIYKNTHVLFINREEAQRILKTDEREIKPLMKMIHEIGPKIVVITDGPDGAYASDGKDVWFMPPYPDPKPPFERTGAGDAFSTGFMAALMYGKDIEEALLWAPISSMSVVQYTGAQKGLLTKSQLEQYIKTAPEDYLPKKI